MNGNLGNHRPWVLCAAIIRLIAAASTFQLLGGVASAQTALERSRQDLTTGVPVGDNAMEAAFAKARATLDTFLALLDKPPPNTGIYAVKLRIVDPASRAVEYFWVLDLKRQGDSFSGIINNTPRSVSNVRIGQRMRFTRAEIYDWMYTDSNFLNAQRSIVGNFTMCALLARETPKEAEELRREVGVVCD